ncbi:hypothetical protein [Dethiothermospora halolimnae]|uniref:hypothetical protein n=1 Tax=Dethiothermospora halolimnae TaxID=3114390 RepID=UPI003CCB9B73
MSITPMNTVGKYNYSNFKKNTITKNKKDFNNVFNNQVKNKKVRHADNSYLRYKSDYKAEVFNVSNISKYLSNPLESTSVEASTDKDISARFYRVFMKKPNSNEKITVDIFLKLKGNKNFKNEKIFKDSIEKAIMLVDKKVSIMDKIGDNIPDSIGLGFDHNERTGEFDFKPHIDSAIRSFQYELDGILNMSQDVKESIMKDLNDCILEIFEKN